jgi:transcriptional regulator with XRE-family HTH domain
LSTEDTRPAEDRAIGGNALGHLLGARLKALRQSRRLKLQEVGTSVGLSHSFLSMLERGRADISLARLHRLADFYGVTLSELLVEELEEDRPVLIGPKEGDLVERSPGLTLRLIPVGRQLGLQIVHGIFAPHSPRSTPVSHDGDDFFWVLRGEVTMTYGADDYVLRKGEAIAYSARVHHCFRNDTARPAEILSFTTPPYSGIGS